MGAARSSLILMSVLLAACEHMEAGNPRLRQCGFLYSPNGEHAAYFAWGGGASVEAVACSTRCATVLEFAVGPRLAYRKRGQEAAAK
jgi:hypothetical protein